MSVITVNANLGALGQLSDFLDGSHLTIMAANSTTLTLVDPQGDGFTFNGTGLQYSGDAVIAGQFTALTVFKAGGGELTTVTDFAVSAPSLSQTFAFAGLEAAVLQLLSGNDDVRGSSIADLLVGAGGNDTIHGGGGGDVIGGSVGRDKLFGQGGADTFLYVKGDGKDHIMDFTDLNGNADDRIGLTQRMFDSMTIEETATGVTLHFGARNEIAVDHWHAADVDMFDFLIS